MSATFHLGILPNRPMQDCIEMGRISEALGYAGVWVADSHSIMRDAYSILSVLAAQTSKLLLANRLAPCSPEQVTSPTAQSPGKLVFPSRSITTPPHM